MIKPHKHITVLSTLTGTAAPAAKWLEPHGCLQTVMDTPAPGFIRLIMLGGEGVQIRHADRLVAIPTALILALAESVDPGLKPPTPEALTELAQANAPLVPAVAV